MELDFWKTFPLFIHSFFLEIAFIVQLSDKVSSDRFSTSIDHKPKQTIEMKWKKGIGVKF